jgi:hypothetical protein
MIIHEVIAMNWFKRVGTLGLFCLAFDAPQAQAGCGCPYERKPTPQEIKAKEESDRQVRLGTCVVLAGFVGFGLFRLVGEAKEVMQG